MKYLWFVLALLGVVLFFSNPDETDLNNYLKKRAIEQVKKETGVNSGLLDGMVGVFTDVFAKAYVRDNYLFFSVYKLGKHKILGIAGQFVPLNQLDKESLNEIPEMKEFQELDKKMKEIGEEFEKKMQDFDQETMEEIEKNLKKIDEELRVK